MDIILYIVVGIIIGVIIGYLLVKTKSDKTFQSEKENSLQKYNVLEKEIFSYKATTTYMSGAFNFRAP